MLTHKETFEAIGTTWRIESLAALDDSLMSSIHARIEQYNQTYSRFRTDSIVAKMAKKPGTFKFTEDSIALVALYRLLYDITDGKFTPFIGKMLEQAGYDAGYSFKQQRQLALPAWDEAMQWKDNLVTTTQPIVFDIGAAGKGQLIDIISELLDRNDIQDYVIDASGDLVHKGTSENLVGLEHPNDTSKIIGMISVRNSSLCASAGNRRAWGDHMHHIFDPDKRQPTQEIIASWVTAKSTMLSDGLATALFFAAPEKLMEYFDFDYVRMHKNGSVDYSSKFNGELFV